MGREMTYKEYEELKVYEEYFRSAVKYDYISTMLLKDADIIANYYRELTGNRPSNYKGCGHCLFQVVKSVGRIWYKFGEDHPENDRYLVFLSQGKVPIEESEWGKKGCIIKFRQGGYDVIFQDGEEEWLCDGDFTFINSEDYHRFDEDREKYKAESEKKKPAKGKKNNGNNVEEE